MHISTNAYRFIIFTYNTTNDLRQYILQNTSF